MSLYENVIEEILDKDKITKKEFIGVFAKDELPELVPYPSCLILNTDIRAKPGEHWLAIHYSSKGYAYFFDSYGFPPSHYKLETYLNKTAKYWSFNSKRLQGFSEYCGYYCILYLLYKTRKKEKVFFAQFKSNYLFNDNLLDKLIRNVA